MSVDITQCDYAGVWRETWPDTVIPDLSANGRHGTATTTPAWEALSSGQHAIRYAWISTDSPITDIVGVTGYTTSGAFACWARHTQNNSGMAQQSSGAMEGWSLGLRNGRTEFRWSDSGGIHAEFLTDVLSDDLPRHYAVSWSPASLKIWVDATLTTLPAIEVVYGGSVTTKLATTESLSNSAAYRLNGHLADVLLRSTPWTDDEVAWLADPANDLRAFGGSAGTLVPIINTPGYAGNFA